MRQVYIKFGVTIMGLAIAGFALLGMGNSYAAAEGDSEAGEELTCLDKVLVQIEQEDQALGSSLRQHLWGSKKLRRITAKLLNAYLKGVSKEKVGSSHVLVPDDSPANTPNTPFAESLDSTQEFNEMFSDLLNTTLENEWIYDGPGTFPWNPGMMGDDIAMAPFPLYNLGNDEGNPDYIDKANKTVEYELWMLDEVLQGRGTEELIYKSMMGSPALIHGLDYYEGPLENRIKIRSYVQAGCLAGALLAMTTHETGGGFLSPVVFLSAAADMNFDLYRRIPKAIYKRLGLALLEIAHQNYWTTTEYGSYYASCDPDNPVPWDFELSNILCPLVKAFHHTKRLRYLARIHSVQAVMDEHLWDNASYGYWAGPSHIGKGLSNNLFDVRFHILYCKFISRDEFHLNRARDIFTFMENELYDGNGHIGHDTLYTEDYCVGCQFFFLKEVYEYWEQKDTQRSRW